LNREKRESLFERLGPSITGYDNPNDRPRQSGVPPTSPLKRYGGKAVFIAGRRADALLVLGDPKGWRAWVRIAKTMTELERKIRSAKGKSQH
jgi:hypothetical protein